jgi:hypothetical protein
MGSYYQPTSYLKGGKRRIRKTRRVKKHKGGFHPSIMGGVARTGEYLLPIAFRAGSLLIENHFKKRKTTRKNRK